MKCVPHFCLIILNKFNIRWHSESGESRAGVSKVRLGDQMWPSDQFWLALGLLAELALRDCTFHCRSNNSTQQNIIKN